MSVLTLPSGATVTLRDVKTIKSGERDRAFRGMDVVDAAEMDLIMSLSWRVAALMITEWSFDLLPPNVKLESLDELDLDDADALRSAIMPFVNQLTPKFNKTPLGDADPKAPTEDSKTSEA